MTTPEGKVKIVPECDKSSETAYYWYREALDISPTIDEPNGIKWWMCLCLLLSWVVVYFIIQKGIQSSGKVHLFHCIKIINYVLKNSSGSTGCVFI